MKTYSQYGEEHFLLEHFKHKKDGFLVDIGAADGINGSNSRYLIEMGWSGLLVEPGTNNFNKLLELYYGNQNIILEKVGCSDTSSKNTTFFVDKNDEYEQISTFRYEQMIHCKNIYDCEFVTENVDLIKTQDLFDKHSILNIDFLSIDTESLDTEVILGIDFNKCNINLICVEHDSGIMHKVFEEFNYKQIYRNVGNIFFAKN
jgi:FkbM family methyltransferase